MSDYRDRLRAACVRGIERQRKIVGLDTAPPERKRLKRPEADASRKVREFLERHGILVFRRTTGAFRAPDGRRVFAGTPGEADLWCIVRGRHVEIEMKSERGRLSPKQEHWRRVIEGQGGTYIVARGVDDVRFLVAS